VGTSRPRIDHARDAKSLPALGDHHEPGPRRCLRSPASSGPLGPRRTAGGGRQYVVDCDQDFMQAVLWLVERTRSMGSSTDGSEPCPNAEFMRTSAAWELVRSGNHLVAGIGALSQQGRA
jgi:hypothetical protein